MCSFGKHIVLLIYTITIINSERWYAATIFERRDSGNITSNRPSFKPTQNNEQQFTPLALIRSKENYKERDNVKPTVYSIEAQPFQNSSWTASNTVVPVVIRFNNTIDNLNVLKKVQPKRKQIRARCPSIEPKETKKLISKHRSKTRFLEVFQVVEFDHMPCTSSSGLEGKCLPEPECIDAGGTTMGTCADGYGTCCVTQFQCDDRSAAQTGWFTNPSFPLPNTERLTCDIALDKSSDDIKQIRLDFNLFEILPPVNGVCQDDQFIVSGQNVNNVIPILCGINTGQHVYIEVGDTKGPIYLAFQTATSENRLFSIKVTQLTSSDELAAPSGCLQYFKPAQGYLESFNYRDKSDIGIARYASYLNNLNYAMCIERAPETCSVTYTNTDDMQIVNYDPDGLHLIPPGQAGVEILNCPNDWLLIAATRLCGDRLNDGSVLEDFTINAPITDNNAGPIVVWFRSDEAYVGYGFKLFYQLNSCSVMQS
ncbi:unnamed protein product [Arctia plantaginis]|uniref:CUB domain-containing protein n=1 Tax=Arctia plantaginis TaxID=874455 RepID=A0A8S0Z443_ARCPL|nr:unnamed protein product [Arctia plantaginis]